MNLALGQQVRVIDGFGYLSGRVGTVVELPVALDPNRPIVETAFATVRFDGQTPPHHRCDPDILVAA